MRVLAAGEIVTNKFIKSCNVWRGDWDNNEQKAQQARPEANGAPEIERRIT